MEEKSADMRVILECTRDIVGAYVRNNTIPGSELPAFIKSIYSALHNLSSPSAAPAQIAQKPAVPIRTSVTPAYIVCLEDGKHLKMLKRYLRARYDISPEQYRAKWNLPADYPMVAPDYAALRSELARKGGLGRSNRAVKHRRKRT